MEYRSRAKEDRINNVEGQVQLVRNGFHKSSTNRLSCWKCDKVHEVPYDNKFFRNCGEHPVCEVSQRSHLTKYHQNAKESYQNMLSRRQDEQQAFKNNRRFGLVKSGNNEHCSLISSLSCGDGGKWRGVLFLSSRLRFKPL